MTAEFRRRVRTIIDLNGDTGRVRTADELGAVHEHGDAYDDPATPNGVNGHAPEPEPEGEPIAPEPEAWPDPPAPEAYHGLAGEIVRRIEPETEADPAGILMQLLTAFGNACGRTAFFVASRRRHYPNLFCIIAGPTSAGGKGDSWDCVRHVMAAAEPQWLEAHVAGGMSSGEGVIAALNDAPEKGGRRLLAMEEEFGRTITVMRREHSTLSHVIRQAWDRGESRVMRSQNPLKADKVHLSIIGHSTAEELRKKMVGEDSENGFGNRFLFGAVRRTKLLPEGGADVDVADLAHTIRRAVDLAMEAPQLRRTAAARALWAEHYGRLTMSAPGMVGKLLARARAQVLRLSLVYALLDCSAEVDEPHVRAALALWDYSERTVRWLFKAGTGDATGDEILSLLRLAGPAGLSREDIRKGLGGHTPSAETTAALNKLNLAGLATGRRVATGGRSAERWTAVETCVKSVESGKSDRVRT